MRSKFKNKNIIDGNLVGDSARYADWNYVFPDDIVPLTDKIPHTVDGVEVFSIDMDRLRPVQLDRLVATIERSFGTKRSEIFAQLKLDGFHIRALDVKVAGPKRNFF